MRTSQKIALLYDQMVANKKPPEGGFSIFKSDER